MGLSDATPDAVSTCLAVGALLGEAEGGGDGVEEAVGCGGIDSVGGWVGDWGAVEREVGDPTAVRDSLAPPLKVGKGVSLGNALAEVGTLAEGRPLATVDGDAPLVAVSVAGKVTERVGGAEEENNPEAPGEGEPAAVCVTVCSPLCDGVVSLLMGPLWEANGVVGGLCEAATDAAAKLLPNALPDCIGACVVDSVAPSDTVEKCVEDGSPLAGAPAD
jgi:hypothetical protein